MGEFGEKVAAATSTAAASSEEEAGSKVFVYGTLMEERVIQALLGRMPSSQPAALSGYHRYCVSGCVYPAIRPCERLPSTVEGLVLSGMTAREMEIFDDFEDEDYERQRVEVEMLDGSNARALCYVYVWKAHLESQLHGTWDFDEHFAPHIDWYVENAKSYAPAAKGMANDKGVEE